MDGRAVFAMAGPSDIPPVRPVHDGVIEWRHLDKVCAWFHLNLDIVNDLT